MLRGVQALILLTCLMSQAHAENTTQRESWNAVTATIPLRPMTRPPEAIQVQEPYCEFGVGPCGGTCNEEGGKHWDCESTAIPCYQRGQHCTCEVASMCSVKKKR
jgi:hypothetical protein